MLTQFITGLAAFILIASFMSVVLLKAGYKKKKSCSCGHADKCSSHHLSS